MKRRVVVTGLGLVTAVGNDVPTTWRALMNGESGADYIKKFDAEKYSAKFACEVKDFDVLNFLDKKEARRMGAFTHFALAASDEAVKNSGLVIDESNDEMVGTYISSGIGDFWAIEREHEKLLNSGPDRVSPFFIVSAIVNLASGNVSIRHGAKGHGLLGRRSCHWRQLPHNRTRRRRRDDLRRCRKRDHADVGCRICVDACPFDS